jgi:hypothetical protein
VLMFVFAPCMSLVQRRTMEVRHDRYRIMQNVK